MGDDVNPCSRTAPCKTFAGAISKTAAGGEIDVLDPGGYGAVTITKAMTITMPPEYGGVLNSATNGIVVNAAATDTVVLRGLAIQGGPTAAPGLNGIRFLAGAALILDDCTITGNSGFGIDFSPSGASTLFVTNTTIAKNGGGGIVVRPTGGTGSAKVVLHNVRSTSNAMGVRGEGATAAAAGVVMSIIDSEFTQNTNGGVIALTNPGAPVKIVLNHSVTAYNGSNGINSNGAQAVVTVGSSVIAGNGTGLTPENGGQIISYVNNQVRDNTNPGAFTSTTGLQ
ncbi:MAG TPA: right-handed parallel beta-helix repeat-containing protein [Caulobacter sp.]|nr:right-handed parallel beta-helix repeat-containing protein [Caulobacter sp.]